MMMRSPFGVPPLARPTAAAALLVVLAAASGAGASSGDLKSKIVGAFGGVKSYKVTVLGNVRSLGVWQAPDRYQMTTEFAGKTVKTIIVGKDLYEFEDGKWQKSGEASSNLDVDIAGLIRTIAHDRSATLAAQPDQTQDGKRVGTFAYTFANGTDETCNYDKTTYRITRCKADELTLLYSAYNDPSNTIAKVSR